MGDKGNIDKNSNGDGVEGGRAPAATLLHPGNKATQAVVAHATNQILDVYVI